MNQYAEYFVGDSIAHRSGGLEGCEFVFGGVIPGENGVYDVAYLKQEGYAGMGPAFVWRMNTGGGIRLGHGFKAYEEPENKKRPARITSLCFVAIERDHLTIQYEWA